MNEHVREFKCDDCGVQVASFGVRHANDKNLCAECTWLRGIDDPAEREKLRVWLQERAR